MSSEIRIDRPRHQTEFAARDQLLATTMRTAPLNWSYNEEYPLVLSPHTDPANNSFCVFNGETVTAHMNLWLRSWHHTSSQESLVIGLIGNVATHPHHRGQGYTRQLLAHAADSAASQGANAILLWSDLLEFYQKLGFASIGREIRYVISRSERAIRTSIQKAAWRQLSDNDLKAMLECRPKLEWNLGRSISEFRSLLSIPECHVFVKKQGARVQSWFVIGKGSDMVGVIHEWGAKSPEELFADIQTVIQSFDLLELTLLVPGALSGHWHKDFSQLASAQSTHPMALAKALNPLGEMTLNHLAKGFIWGLDSI